MRFRLTPFIMVAAFLAGCSPSSKLGVTGDEARQVIASVARERGAAFSLTEAGRPKRSIDEMVAWLKSHPQPPVPEKQRHPKEGPGCDGLRKPSRFISYVPTPVKMVLAATDSFSWAFVRFDIDDKGNTYNLRPAGNSGFREFSDASLISGALWKYSDQPQAFGLKDCTGLFQVVK